MEEFERPVNDEVVTGWLSVTIQYSHTECDGVWREGSGKPLELLSHGREAMMEREDELSMT